MKKIKPVSYILHYNFERNKVYFKKKLKKYQDIYDGTLVNKARGDNCLNANTAFFVFPVQIYQRRSINVHEYFFVFLSKQDISVCYDEEKDHWTTYTMYTFAYALRTKPKFTEEKPGLTLNIELYDIDIINRYKKHKDRLIDPREVDHSSDFISERYTKIKL